MRTLKTTLIALFTTLLVGGFIFLILEYPNVSVYPDIYYEYQSIPMRPGPIEHDQYLPIPTQSVESIPHIVGVGKVSILFKWT